MITKSLLFINTFLILISLGKWNSSPTDFYFSKKADSPFTVTVAAPEMLCDGTLGENIFTDGDFGSGPMTNLSSDANGYAPGYSYQSSPPPLDGFYTITNNTSSWGSFASNWVNTGDNSNDPNGYMMVVNASFSPGIFYEKTIDNLCENTLYEFSADAINLLRAGLGGIRPNLDFLIDGVVQYSTGEIPTNEQWNNYGFTFISEPGTSSLTLTIRNKAPGGDGNDLALDNISFRACGPEIAVNTSIQFICSGQPATLVADIIGSQYPTPVYQWEESTDGGTTWNSLAGENNSTLFLSVPVADNLYRILVSNSVATIDNSKCRVISNVKEIEFTSVFFNQFDTLCQGMQLQVGNSIYNVSGVYLDSLISTSNCDSIVTTNLTIAPDLGITADFEVQSPACPANDNATISITNVQNGSGIYEYALNNEPFQSAPFFGDLLEGNYQVTIRDHYACEATYAVDIITPLNITLDLGADVNILLGETVAINPSVNLPPSTVVWSPALGLDCADCLQPNAAPTETTTYQVTVTDAQNCIATDELTIFVDNTRIIFIPNAFSPNGDGTNDFLTIYGGQDVAEILSFQVFNRWGAMVFALQNFQPNDELLGWNGMVNGKNVAEGVYIYRAEVLFKDGLTEQYVGDVTITN